jgi:hypothetical protein
MKKIGDLSNEWGSHYHDIIFPKKTDDWENKHLENDYDEYKTYGLIERLQSMEIVNKL